jgi:hypothetical protein
MSEAVSLLLSELKKLTKVGSGLQFTNIMQEFIDRVTKELEKENKELKLKLTGRLQNAEGNYDPILVQLWYLQKLEKFYKENQPPTNVRNERHEWYLKELEKFYNENQPPAKE